MTIYSMHKRVSPEEAMRIYSDSSMMFSGHYEKSVWSYASGFSDGETVAVIVNNNGLLEFPWGPVREDERYAGAAERILAEQTGIAADNAGLLKDFVNYPVFKDRGGAMGIFEFTGTVWLFDKESGRGYVGRVIRFDLEDFSQALKSAGDMKAEHAGVDDILEKRRRDFPPVQQLLLDLVAWDESRRPVRHPEDLEFDRIGIREYLQTDEVY